MDDFDALMAEAGSADGHFGHREHLHLAWLAVRRHGAGAATALITDGIRRTARYAGNPQKYHATVTHAWISLVAHHVAEAGPDEFGPFLDTNPRLLDKRLLGGHYSSTRLASAEAREGFVEPDLRPLPAV
jgi:hypothetical protein